MQVAHILDELGVDVIEAGFPIASNGDFEAVSEIAKIVKNATVCGLARAGAKDIDRAGEAIKHAEKRRIHTFISTSPVHMKYKLQMEPDRVYEKVIESVTRARNWTDDVEWSAEDGTRTEFDFLCKCVEAAINAGCHHDQYSRHGRLYLAARNRRHVQTGNRSRSKFGQGDFLCPLP